MAQQYDYVFSVTGNEKAFFSGLSTFLSNLSSKIVCTSNLDVEFSGSDTSHVPQINFSIDGKVTFYFRRGEGATDKNLTQTTGSYRAVCGNASQTLKFFEDNQAYYYHASATRSWRISSLIGTDFLYFLINTSGKNNLSQIENKNLAIAYTNDDIDSYYNASTTIDRSSKATVYNLSGRTFKQYSTSNTAVFTSRFNHTAPPGQIDYIRSAVYCTNGEKYFDIYTIYDCSNVTVCDTVSLKDGSYYAIGPHQLVKMS